MKLILPTEITPARLVSSTVPEDDHPEWNAATAYNIGDRVMVLAEHAIYEALASHTNKPPAGSPDDWLKVGATNRWAMFDDRVGTQTTAPGSLTIELAPGLISALALFNASAYSVRVEMIDPTEGTVFDETHVLQGFAGITDFWDYFFAPIERSSSLFVPGLPSYLAAVLRLTFSDGAAETIKCGALVLGVLHEFAPAVLLGARVGIQSFSRKERDDFGNWKVTKRASSKRADWRFVVDAARVGHLQNLLASLDAVPTVFIGSGKYESLLVYGFYRDFSIEIAYPRHSLCSIEIEGLI